MLSFPLSLPPAQRRLVMALSGSGFALALYGMVEWMAPLESPLWAVSLLGALAVTALGGLTLLAMVPPLWAMAAAVAHGALAFVLIAFSNGAGVAELGSLDNSQTAFLGFVIFATLPLPFVVAAHRGDWKSYTHLFHSSWHMLLIWCMGLIFTLLAWGVVFGGGALLDLVGLPILDTLMEREWAVCMLTGLMLGLGGAVAAELQMARPGREILRLLRLLALPFLAVLVIFLVALPFRGVNALAISLTLLTSWSVMVAATLVSAILDSNDTDASQAPALRWGARAICLIMVPMAGLAVWAISIRVAAYGFTPERVVVLTLALIAAGYAACYMIALVTRWNGNWMGAIRQGNVTMATALILLSVLWVAGIYSPEAIGTKSQLARYEKGEITLDELPIRDLARGWGKAGRDGLEALRARHADDPEILAKLNQSYNATTAPWDAPSPDQVEDELAAQILLQNLRKDVAQHLTILPADHPEAKDFVQKMITSVRELQVLLAACEERTPDGNKGCVAVLGDFTSQSAGAEAMILTAGQAAQVAGWSQTDAKDKWIRMALIWDNYAADIPASIDKIHRNGPEIRPSGLQRLELDMGGVIFKPNL